MLIQCTPLLVEKAGVAPDVHHMQASNCVVERTTLALKPMGGGGGSHEIQNKGNQWPYKMDLCPTKILKNKNECPLHNRYEKLPKHIVILSSGWVLFVA